MSDYKDEDGKATTLHHLCRTSPEWAASRIEFLTTEGGERDGLIRLLLKECEEMEFDHSNACMNWSSCEHSQIECALCQLRDLVSGKQS